MNDERVEVVGVIAVILKDSNSNGVEQGLCLRHVCFEMLGTRNWGCNRIEIPDPIAYWNIEGRFLFGLFKRS